MPRSTSWPQPAVLENLLPSSTFTSTVVESFSSDGKTKSTTDTDPSNYNYTHRVLALYKFVSPKIPKEDLPNLKKELETVCRHHSARGTLLIAEEGINGTICYPFRQFDTNYNCNDDSVSKKHAETDTQDKLLFSLQEKFDGALRIRKSVADRPVFARLKIKIKSEIVTMQWWGDADADGACSNTKNANTKHTGDITTTNNNNNANGDSDNSGSSVSCGPCCPTERVGEYVKPNDWNKLLEDPDTLVIDTRNEYEIDVGTFRNAIDPHTQSFVEFPDWIKRNLVGVGGSSNENENDKSNLATETNLFQKKKKIAMFCKLEEWNVVLFCSTDVILYFMEEYTFHLVRVCAVSVSTFLFSTTVTDHKICIIPTIGFLGTGGIRCEKATNAAMQLIPNDIPVYHLEGGILAYLDEVSEKESMFDGDCYVFDQRVAVTYKNKPSSTFRQKCHACRHPLSNKDLERGDYKPGVSCRYCVGKLSHEQEERFAQRQRQIQLALEKGRQHIHDPKEEMTGNKKICTR